MPTFRQDEKLGTKVPLIKTADFNDKSVTTEKLAEGSVTNSKLAPESVTQDKFDKELLQIFKAAAGLPENLIETIQNVDSTLVDHQRQISSNDDDISDLQTKTKQIKDTVDGIAVSGGASVGSAVTYDNTQSGLDAQNIQNAIDELVNNLGHYETNEEWLRVYTDAENKFLWGIRVDGSIDWAVGIPKPIQKAINEIIANSETFQQTLTEAMEAYKATIDEKVAAIDEKKVDKEEGKSLIEDEVKERFRVIENEEFIKAVVDSEDRVLFGFYRATGKPYYPLNEMYHVIQNEEFLWVILDAANHPLLGIQQDGTSWAAKAQWLDDIKAIKEALKTFQPKEDGKGLINLDVADSFFYISNDEYIIAVVDAENRILAGIKYDAQPYFPNHEMYSVIANEEWLYAIIDAENKILGGFRADDGHMVVGGIDISTFIVNAIVDIADTKERTSHLSTIENDEYLAVETDAEGKVIGYIAPDGSHYLYNVKSETIPTELSHIEDLEGRTEITTDSEDNILGYRGSDGTRYEHKFNAKNLSVTNLNLEENGNCASEIKNALEKIGFTAQTPMDWSKNDYLQIPEPLCAKLNLITDKMPTAKSGMGISGVNCDIPCIAQFWDMQGNYFRISALISAQGSSSMAFPKKNIAIDLFNDENRKNNFSIKFGDWVAQDSFHLKAYYTDFFRGVGAVGYQIFNEIAKSKGIGKERPYMSYTSKYGTGDIGVDTIDDLKLNVDTGAKCFPMGFPVIIYQNGVFYGVYSWQLKKHRDNMHMDKKTAEHIHLDGVLDGNTIFGGKVDWTQFEVRNPKKLYMQEKHIIKGEETLEYNGDYPFEIMGEDSAFYDSSNKDMKRCAQVKKYILNLSNRISELSTAVSTGTREEDIKKLFDKYFNASFIIDYFLEINLVGNGDGTSKNWQWTTYDGIKWVCNPYDLDAAFGSYHLGNIAFSNDTNYGTWRGTSLTIPTGWIFKYYNKELKLQWENLKKIGIFNAEHITSLVKTWSDRIGIDNWVKEYSKWKESPCNRASLINSKYWDFSRIQVSTVWSEKGTYTKDTDVLYKGKVYRSLVNNNKGNEPTENNVYWKDLTYNNDIEYTQGDICYYGKTTFYSFTCKLNCIGQTPFTGFYSQYPYEAGHFDSIYRVFNFVTNSIAHIDENIRNF